MFFCFISAGQAKKEDFSFVLEGDDYDEQFPIYPSAVQRSETCRVLFESNS